VGFAESRREEPIGSGGIEWALQRAQATIDEGLARFHSAQCRRLPAEAALPMPSKTNYERVPVPRGSVINEQGVEEGFIEKLRGLKYPIRPDNYDRATLEANFSEKFEALNSVRLTDGEIARLLDEIVAPDVFTAVRTLRQINAFTRETTARR
jgi:hypothetical protein